MVSLTRAAAVAELDWQIAKESFAEFCSQVTIRSDDPMSPQPIPFLLWPRQLEYAELLQTGGSYILLKERQIGVTWETAAYLYWRLVYYGWACGYFSIGQTEARGQIERIRYIHTHLPPHLQGRVEFTADDVKAGEGAFIHAFPSTESAGVSYTLQLAIMDELAFHPYGQQNLDALRPAVRQLILQSTADPSLGPSGVMYDTYFRSRDGTLPYGALFYGRGSRPERTPAWYEGEEEVYAGRKDVFDAFYPVTPEAAFVGRSGLVYPMFSAERHVKPAPCTWAEYKYRVAGVDPGGGDPTAIVPLGVTRQNMVHQPGEFYRRGPVGTDELAAYLLGLHRQAPFHLVLVGETGGSVITASLVKAGLPAVAADMRRGEGMGIVASFLEQDRLTISPECTYGIAEFPGYRWANRTDPNDKTRYATSTPVDNHADAKDGLRYGLVEVHRLLVLAGAVVQPAGIQYKVPTRRKKERVYA